MASLDREKRGGKEIGWRIRWVEADGRQVTLRLGDITRRNAERMLLLTERLLESKRLGLPLDGETARWVSELSPEMADRLARLGLIARRFVSVEQWLTRWYEQRKAAGYKPSSLIAWGQVIRDLTRLFGQVEMARFSHQEAEKFREDMQARGLRPSTIQKRLQHACCMFGEAVREGIIQKNPFEAVRARGGNPEERRVYVPVETVLRVIEACPSVHWRLLIALGRFGGLRIPSEALSLRWADILWAEEKILVPSPKTERQGKPYRVIPMFPMLRPYLEEAWEAAPEGAEWVFPEEWRKRAMGPSGWRNCNFRTVFEKILRRAGVEVWPRLWHNLRASCETDLAQAFPLATVVRWIGNSPAIAMRHYVDVTDEAFERAKRWRPSGVGENIFSPCGQKCGQVEAKNAAKQASATESTEQKILTQSLVDFQVTPSFANLFGIAQNCPLEAAGIEPASRGGLRVGLVRA
jgi:integrase